MSWSESLSTSLKMLGAAFCGWLGHGIEIILQFGLPGASRHRLRLGEVVRLFCYVALGCLEWLILKRLTFNSCVGCDCSKNLIVSWKNDTKDWGSSSCHIPNSCHWPQNHSVPWSLSIISIYTYLHLYETWSLSLSLLELWSLVELPPFSFMAPFFLKAKARYRIKSCNIFGYK